MIESSRRIFLRLPSSVKDAATERSVPIDALKPNAVHQ